MRVLKWLAPVFSFFILAMPALALDAPAGRVIVALSGQITDKNVGETAVFDDKMLDALPVHELKTTSPWYQGQKTFRGPLFRDLLAKVGGKGNKLVITALNDYAATVPYEDVMKYDVVLARYVDGKKLSVRDKGPLFMIYPFDDKPEIKNDVFFSRAVWQIKAIRVE